VFTSEPTNGPGGPFSGDEVVAGLRRVGWKLVDVTEDRVAVLVYARSGEEVFLDLDKQVYYDDPFFRATAFWMVDPRLGPGKTHKDVLESQMKAMRDAIIRARAEGGEGYTAEEGDPQ
jgi:hypothetical protein